MKLWLSLLLVSGHQNISRLLCFSCQIKIWEWVSVYLNYRQDNCRKQNYLTNHKDQSNKEVFRHLFAMFTTFQLYTFHYCSFYAYFAKCQGLIFSRNLITRCINRESSKSRFSFLLFGLVIILPLNYPQGILNHSLFRTSFGFLIFLFPFNWSAKCNDCIKRNSLSNSYPAVIVLNLFRKSFSFSFD